MAAGGPTGWVSRARRSTTAAVALGLLMGACGDDSAGGSDGTLSTGTSADSTTTDTDLPSCREVDHTVVFSVFGAATVGAGDELAAWLDDPDAEPLARPGAAEVVRAYQALGYEIMYVTSRSADTVVGDRPLIDAVTVWLGVNDFPVGENTRVWAPEGEGDPSVALIEELARLGVAGVELHAGYAGDPDAVFPLVTGGIPRERVFTVGEAVQESSTSLPDEDFEGHLAEVQALERVCD